MVVGGLYLSWNTTRIFYGAVLVGIAFLIAGIGPARTALLPRW